MNKTKIEWADYTWNPIKGLCPEACWYCYARRMYHRFRLDDFYEHPEFHATRGEISKMDRLPSSRIFICSTMEMFHPLVKDIWRDRIFRTIEMFPQHTFIILTKRPERIDRPMPDNVWLGVSINTAHDMWRIEKLYEALAVTRFVSFEPMLDPIKNFQEHLEGTKRDMLQWIIVGRLTGHGKARDPEREWVEQLVMMSRFYRIPIFMKNNLKGIRPGPLIQEWPKEAR